MSILKTGLIAASLCLAASFAHAGTSAPMQGRMSWNNAAKSAFASAQPRMAKSWTQCQGHARSAAKRWKTNPATKPFVNRKRPAGRESPPVFCAF